MCSDKQVCPICTGYVIIDMRKPYLDEAYNWLFSHQCGNIDDVDGFENQSKFSESATSVGYESAFDAALNEDSKRWAWNL